MFRRLKKDKFLDFSTARVACAIRAALAGYLRASDSSIIR